MEAFGEKESRKSNLIEGQVVVWFDTVSDRLAAKLCSDGMHSSLHKIVYKYFTAILPPGKSLIHRWHRPLDLTETANSLRLWHVKYVWSAGSRLDISLWSVLC